MIIKHRINSVAALRETETKYGVEVDLQLSNGRLVVGHDPGVSECSFNEWLTHYSHAFIAANIKQEGIEREVIAACEERGITKFFLFDLSFPALFTLQKQGERRIAIRVSDMEAFQTLELFKEKVDWVWLDAFESYSFITDALPTLQHFKVCFVSPELHINRNQTLTDNLLLQLGKLDLNFQAVCTKDPIYWEGIR
jgi:hypothetical protein